MSDAVSPPSEVAARVHHSPSASGVTLTFGCAENAIGNVHDKALVER